MRVLMYYSNNDVRLEEIPVPQTGAGELLLKVWASGICGSDVMEWYRRDKVPLVLGHEVAGEVVEVGAGVDRFKVGDRVAATHHVPCNTCHHCLGGHHTVCETLLKGTHFDPGGFAEYVRVPAINVDRGVFHIPEGVSFEEASFMEPLACVLRGQRRAGLSPGQTVLVLGSGISGLLHVGLARALGAGLVVAADTIAFRLKRAEEMGADLALQADDHLPELLRRANQGRLADLVIICFDGFIPLALNAVEKGGTVLFFAGAAEGATLPATINDLFWRTEITLTSTYAGAPYDCLTALRLIRERGIRVMETVTHRLGMSEAHQGFRFVSAPAGHDCIKVIVEPHR
ncbi:MAG: alcohol dehydrogenase catalytic domain-containing protein [Deltaproteobacteria bacterium]|nr:alcohol dehydrogenase catalytic domain-containing protein [Deltaproteobacteria bacterium]MBW2049414.1 alcohol dehydrogenase catalytic domain-containing protein [Deltaproteobacteria bacterium]MBW2110361.1 alcohol dehydrogenase catalytic domain-containing protein [Deltaproteobacteria bacterium]MBW2352267.1 alcohol dehydrogenase catalytic domain-containing protein [Deltaproteobacteria bacterium]HDZ91455.1 alcohol dehydrogenase [Deltaproteobacteria bacterium]